MAYQFISSATVSQLISRVLLYLFVIWFSYPSALSDLRGRALGSTPVARPGATEPVRSAGGAHRCPGRRWAGRPTGLPGRMDGLHVAGFQMEVLRYHFSGVIVTCYKFFWLVGRV